MFRTPLALTALVGLLLLTLPTPSAPQTPPAAAEAPRWPGLEGGGAYVLFLDHGVTLVNGSARDFQRAGALRSAAQEQLFWFQLRGREYVIRDTILLQQLQALFEAPMKLGAQRAALTDQAAKLAAKLAGITAQQQRQGEVQEDFGVRMNQLAAEQASLLEQGEDAEPVEEEMRSLEMEQARLQQPQEQLANQRNDIELQQQSLARQEEDLGRQEQQATQEAERQLHALVDQAISKGTAKPVK
jgi:bla regulator protein BlaR1